MVDYFLGYFLLVGLPKIFNRSAYIFDRYFYDLQMDPLRFRIELPNFILKYATLMLPKPDVILCLFADPEVIYLRKPELPVTELIKQIELLRNIASKDSRFICISTSESISETVEKSYLAICSRAKKLGVNLSP